MKANQIALAITTTYGVTLSMRVRAVASDDDADSADKIGTAIEALEDALGRAFGLPADRARPAIVVSSQQIVRAENEPDPPERGGRGG